MITVPVTLTSTAQSIASLVESSLPNNVLTLVGDRDDFRQDVIIQAVSGNGSNVGMGSPTDQSGFIIAGTSRTLERANLNRTYLVGDGLEVVILLLNIFNPDLTVPIIPANPATYWNETDASGGDLITTQWGLTTATLSAGTFDSGRILTVDGAGQGYIIVTLSGQDIVNGLEWFLSVPTDGGTHSIKDGSSTKLMDNNAFSLVSLTEDLGNVTLEGAEHSLMRLYVNPAYDPAAGDPAPIYQYSQIQIAVLPDVGPYGQPVYFWDGDPR